MKKWYLAWIVGLAMLSGPAMAQRKSTKAPAAKQPPTVQELILQGKNVEAVRLARRTPNGAQDALKKLLGSVDLDITDRQLTKAGATLEAAEKFADEWAKANKNLELPREELTGRKLRLQGIKLSDKEEYAKAEEILKQALDLSKKAKDSVLEAGIRNNLGYALRFQKKLEEASREYDTARQIAESQKDNLRAASYNLNLGQVLLQLDRTGFAIAAFKRSAEQSHAASRPNLEARAILMRGMAEGAIDAKGSEPFQLLQQAEQMFEQQGDDLNIGLALSLMADRTAYNMNFAEAAALGERAIPYLLKAKDRAGLQRCYYFLSDMYNKLGNALKSGRYKKLADEMGG